MSSRLRLIASGLAAGLLFGTAPPAVAASGCTFKSSGGMTLVFSLDPSSPFDVIATATPFSLDADKWGSCPGSVGSMYMTVNGSLSMSNGSAVIPYALTLPAAVTPAPTGGTNYVSYTLQGKVFWTDFADKPAGAYTSNVTIQVNP